jgi:hypothetical protein
MNNTTQKAAQCSRLPPLCFYSTTIIHPINRNMSAAETETPPVDVDMDIADAVSGKVDTVLE